MPVAAIDIGTNSVRLLVRSDGPDGQELERRAVITRLGEGVDRTRTLSPAAIERTIDELVEHRALLDRHGVGDVAVIATSAVRDADNRDEFLALVSATLGRPVRLVSGQDEGRLAFLGATRGLDPADGPFLVVDVGGGSTEFILGTTEPEGVTSVDMGAVRLTEGYLTSDPPRAEELSNAIGVVSDYMEDVTGQLTTISEVATVIGVGGTFTTMAAVDIGLVTYDRDQIHGFRLTREGAEEVFRTLATERLADRKHNPGLEEARADVIVGGCCIVVGVMRRLHLAEVVISESDLLDALVASL